MYSKPFREDTELPQGFPVPDSSKTEMIEFSRLPTPLDRHVYLSDESETSETIPSFGARLKRTRAINVPWFKYSAALYRTKEGDADLQ